MLTALSVQHFEKLTPEMVEEFNKHIKLCESIAFNEGVITLQRKLRSLAEVDIINPYDGAD